MNLIDVYITKIVSAPYEIHGGWWARDLEYQGWGILASDEFYFQTKEEAENVKIGDKFLR